MPPSGDLQRVRSMLDAHAPAVMLTYRPDGSADVSPVWFRSTDDAFEVVVATSDKKFDHLSCNRRAVLMIFETVPPFRGVKVTADVEMYGAGLDESRRAIAERYLGAGAAATFVAARGPGVVVRFPVSAARSWDLSGIMPASP